MRGSSVANRIVVVLTATLVTAAVLVVGAAPAQAYHNDSPYIDTFPNHAANNYQGHRFYDMTALICVEDRANKVRAAGRSKYIKNSVAKVNATAARMIYRYGKGSCAGTGYKYRAIIVDNYYSGWGRQWSVMDPGPKCSSTRKSHCVRWYKTAKGHWTWIYTSYVVIKLNLNLGIPRSNHLWLHELTHVAMGIKDKPTWSHGGSMCQSVMSYCAPGSSWNYFVRPDTDIKWFNQIRVQ